MESMDVGKFYRVSVEICKPIEKAKYCSFSKMLLGVNLCIDICVCIGKHENCCNTYEATIHQRIGKNTFYTAKNWNERRWNNAAKLNWKVEWTSELRLAYTTNYSTTNKNEVRAASLEKHYSVVKPSLFFSAHFYNMEGKSSTQNAQMQRFFYADLLCDDVRLLTLVFESDLEKILSPS